MRLLQPALCALLVLGCAKSPASDNKTATSQFAEANIVFGPPSDPAHPEIRPGQLTCTVALIPAYKHQDAAQLALWVFPRSSAPMLNMDCDLSNPALQGRRAPILAQAFTAEGALLNFQAAWPGGETNQIIALDMSRKGRRLVRVFGTLQGGQ